MDQGKYRARAARHSFGVAKTGTEYVAVEFELLDDDEKRTIVWRGYFHSKTAERTLEALRYAGAALEDDDIFDLRGLGSTEVQLVVELEAGERGGSWPVVRYVNRLPSARAMAETTMDQDAMRRLRERMRGVLRAHRAASSGRAERVRDVVRDVMTEDVPF